MMVVAPEWKPSGNKRSPRLGHEKTIIVARRKLLCFPLKVDLTGTFVQKIIYIFIP